MPRAPSNNRPMRSSSYRASTYNLHPGTAADYIPAAVVGVAAHKSVVGYRSRRTRHSLDRCLRNPATAVLVATDQLVELLDPALEPPAAIATAVPVE